MRDRQVVALEVVVDVDLPVALDDVVAPLDERACGRRRSRPRHLGRDGAHHLGQRRRVVGQVDEDERAPALDAHGDEAEVLLGEALGVLHLGRGAQAAVEPVRPAVVAALERLAVALRERDLARAMPADVVEGAQLAVEAVRDDDRLVEDRDRDEVADALELIGPCHELPGAAEDPLLLALEDVGVEVVARRQRGCAAERRRRWSRSCAAVYRCRRVQPFGRPLARTMCPSTVRAPSASRT